MTFNTTVFASLASQPQTYWETYDAVSQYNVQLNIFEKLWAAWYAYMQNDVLATGIMSFLMHEIVYFGRSLPFIIMDMMPYFRRYKIQNVRCPPYSALAPPLLMPTASPLKRKINTVSSKKSLLNKSNGTAPNSSSSLTSPSSSPKSGSSTPWPNSLACPPACPSPP